MKISQKITFGYTKTYFEFGDRKLDYMVTGERADFGFSVFYEHISFNKSLKTIVEKWPIYLILVLWLGCVVELLVDRSFEQNHISQILLFGSFSLILPLIFIQRRVMKNDATLLETPMGKVVILLDDKQKSILDEIEQRRKAALKKKFGEVDLLNDPAQELSKFRQLKEHGVLTDAEFNTATSKLPLTVRT